MTEARFCTEITDALLFLDATPKSNLAWGSSGSVHVQLSQGWTINNNGVVVRTTGSEHVDGTATWAVTDQGIRPDRFDDIVWRPEIQVFRDGTLRETIFGPSFSVSHLDWPNIVPYSYSVSGEILNADELRMRIDPVGGFGGSWQDSGLSELTVIASTI